VLRMLLHALPVSRTRMPWRVALLDLPARVVLPRVRTRGSTRPGRQAWYGACDLHPIVDASARLAGVDLGGLRAVGTPVRFGFGSTPRALSLVRVTTTVEILDRAHR
jgi:hypothetical protein